MFPTPSSTSGSHPVGSAVCYEPSTMALEQIQELNWLEFPALYSGLPHHWGQQPSGCQVKFVTTVFHLTAEGTVFLAQQAPEAAPRESSVSSRSTLSNLVCPDTMGAEHFLDRKMALRKYGFQFNQMCCLRGYQIYVSALVSSSMWITPALYIILSGLEMKICAHSFKIMLIVLSGDPVSPTVQLH